MKFNWRQFNPLWFTLFLFNKVALTFLPKSLQQPGAIGNDMMPESWVAAIVFIATFSLFMRFTVDTIGQITTYLNINCLTIKKKETWDDAPLTMQEMAAINSSVKVSADYGPLSSSSSNHHSDETNITLSSRKKKTLRRAGAVNYDEDDSGDDEHGT
jgi:hypothetical protein